VLAALVALDTIRVARQPDPGDSVTNVPGFNGTLVGAGVVGSMAFAASAATGYAAVHECRSLE
jgi:hypothetical protein